MQNQSRQNATRKKKGAGTIKITLTISKALLNRVDKAAKEDYTTRSDIIRQGLLWYLRPQGRELDQADPEVILKALNQRKMKAELNKIVKDIDPDSD